MLYLHKSPIASHGNLSSANCLVDNRWVLKISGFGLQAFQDDELEKNKSEEERCKESLWTAPELLQMKTRPACGTQKGDVYSFAIVMQEIIDGNFPFSGFPLTHAGSTSD